MKNKNIIMLIIVLLITIGTTGCGNVVNSDNGILKEETKGNCEVFECMEKLDPNSSIEDMTKVIGIEPYIESEDDKYASYSYDLSDEISINVRVSKTWDNKTISADVSDRIINNKADFSRWNEIKSKLDGNDSIMYDEFVKLVGGVEGVIIQKDESSIHYKWVNKDGGYLYGYFATKTGKCTLATGRF